MQVFLLLYLYKRRKTCIDKRKFFSLSNKLCSIFFLFKNRAQLIAEAKKLPFINASLSPLIQVQAFVIKILYCCHDQNSIKSLLQKPDQFIHKFENWLFFLFRKLRKVY